MKTKGFLMACLIFGIGFTQISAQTEVTKEVGPVGWGCPIYCNGQQVDYLYGYGYMLLLDHYIKGEWQWEQMLSFKGIGWSMATQEEFKFNEQDRIKMSPKLGNYTWTWNDNIKGSNGTWYNISGYMLWIDGLGWSDVVIKNATCTGNVR